MENTIRQILPLWGVETEHLEQMEISRMRWDVRLRGCIRRSECVKSCLSRESFPGILILT